MAVIGPREGLWVGKGAGVSHSPLLNVPTHIYGWGTQCLSTSKMSVQATSLGDVYLQKGKR